LLSDREGEGVEKNLAFLLREPGGRLSPAQHCSKPLCQEDTLLLDRIHRCFPFLTGFGGLFALYRQLAVDPVNKGNALVRLKNWPGTVPGETGEASA
jgi:hypothetical protein